MPSESSSLYVAIVGTGPAALYAAAELAKLESPIAHVDLFDRLPTMGGLARAGVAPDHADRRKVIDACVQQARRSGRLRFFGNLEIGRDLSHSDLTTHYDAVIYAVGGSRSRALEIPGADLPGCFGSSEFVAWYNGHPDQRELPVSLDCERAVVIGNGNVAIDVARVLLKRGQALACSDMARHARVAINGSRVREVCVLGRRGPAQAAFSHPELSELGMLEDVDVVVNASDLANANWDPSDYQAGLKRAALESYARTNAGASARQLTLRFLSSPVEVIGKSRVEGVRIARNQLVAGPDGRLELLTGSETEQLPAGLVVHATGYRGSAVDSALPFDDQRGIIPNHDGRVLDSSGTAHMPGSYVTGWIKRGPRGVIGSNKACARQTVASLLEDFQAQALNNRQQSPDKLIDQIRNQKKSELVDFRGWRRIDRHEREQAGRDQPREKLTRIEEMLSVAGATA